MPPVICIALIIFCALVAIAGAVWTLIELLPEGRHARPRETPEPEPSALPHTTGLRFGSMCLDAELDYRSHAPAFSNGHTLGCVRPGEDHPGACPETGDWPDAHQWPAAEPDAIDAVLALEQEDPANAGWTDQLLADLRDAPTVLDGPPDHVAAVAAEIELAERLADTGEIHLAGVRADWAAELDAQDDDAAEFMSRMASAAAELRISGLA